MTFRVPSRDFLGRTGGSARFVLIPQNLRFGDGFRCVDRFPDSNSYILDCQRYESLDFEYLLWDAQEEQPVSFGFAQEINEDVDATWSELVAQCAKSILSESPLH